MLGSLNNKSSSPSVSASGVSSTTTTTGETSPRRPVNLSRIMNDKQNNRKFQLNSRTRSHSDISHENNNHLSQQRVNQPLNHQRHTTDNNHVSVFDMAPREIIMDFSQTCNRREKRSLDEQVKSVTRFLLIQRHKLEKRNLTRSALEQVELSVMRMFGKEFVASSSTTTATTTTTATSLLSNHAPPPHNHSNNNNSMDELRSIIQGVIRDFAPNAGSENSAMPSLASIDWDE